MTELAELDAQILRLVDTRVAAARAEGRGLRPDEEAIILRTLLEQPRPAATSRLVLRLWRALMAETARPMGVAVWGGTQALELAAARFPGSPLRLVQKPEDALSAARAPGAVGVLALDATTPWWLRLLAEPKLKVFAALPELAADGDAGALAVGDVPLEPSGGDDTFWVTDAAVSPAAIEEALGRDGLAGRLVSAAGGLKLFALAGYVQVEDARLARAPGRLSGVIGAAPSPFDL